jgi:hypothetical protein
MLPFNLLGFHIISFDFKALLSYDFIGLRMHFIYLSAPLVRPSRTAGWPGQTRMGSSLSAA